jgi:eukaryotic-like serine/threonine-protein kinase
MFGVSGKYRLDRRLGGGGMAEVFLASSIGAEGFSRKVAIKRVLPGYSENEAFARMFVAEARISSQLVHPNIVSVLDFDRDADGRLFLVMELVEGKDLDALLATGVVPVPLVIFIIAEVLRGLDHAHDLPLDSEVRGIVHRDISPHNVLLSWTGAVKVSDFGIAKARYASEATASEMIKGKPAYMSPEQANGKPLDGRSDLFAVGIMLWEMLIGHRLFAAEDTRAMLAAVLFGQIPRPRSIRADVPKDLERVTMKLLERDPSTRYQTAADALRDLLACADTPTTGRELLVTTLAARFAAEVPVRQSLLRARSADQAMQAVVPPPEMLPLIPPGSHETRPATAMPSLGSLRNAPTGTMRATGASRRGPRIAVFAILAVVVGAAGTFALVRVFKDPGQRVAEIPDDASSLDQPPTSTSPPDARAEEPDAEPVTLATVTDAGVMDLDAAAPPQPPRDAGSSTPPIDVAPAKKRYGSLRVISDPIVTVWVDGKRHGDSPITIEKLLVGRHVVHMKNPFSTPPVDDRRPVVIRENQLITIER